MMKLTVILSLVIVATEATAILSGQARGGDTPAFEVASIKPNTSGDARSGTRDLPGGRVSITNLRLRDVIRSAYGSNDLK